MALTEATLAEHTTSGMVRPGAVILVAASLMAIGVVMVSSTTASLDRALLAPGMLRTAHGRQIVFALVGLAMMVILSRLAVGFLASESAQRRISLAVFVFAVGCLVAALIPGIGEAHHGSHRWLRVAPFGFEIGFQPSEPTKLALVAWLAALLATRGVDPRSFSRCFVPAALSIGVCVILVGKEDFGTSVLLMGVGAAMLFTAGSRLRHLAIMGLAGAGALTVLLFAAPYRMARITAFTDMWSDTRGGGYQPLQSLTTIASGGWFGRGLGAGVQKYGYLPESHTDFIFAVICEETGVFGAALVIALFCVFIWLGLKIMLAAPSRFERLLAFGLTATTALQAAMNIAVVVVVAPTTGISLPWISAGGSGMLTFCLVSGVLAAIALRGINAASFPKESGASQRIGPRMIQTVAAAW